MFGLAYGRLHVPPLTPEQQDERVDGSDSQHGPNPNADDYGEEQGEPGFSSAPDLNRFNFGNGVEGNRFPLIYKGGRGDADRGTHSVCVSGCGVPFRGVRVSYGKSSIGFRVPSIFSAL